MQKTETPRIPQSVRNLLEREVASTSESISDDMLRLIDPDYIERKHRRSVLSDILHLLEIA
jgi:hypothetical protein